MAGERQVARSQQDARTVRKGRMGNYAGPQSTVMGFWNGVLLRRLGGNLSASKPIQLLARIVGAIVAIFLVWWMLRLYVL
jgi:hypothetical protein